MHVCSHQTQGNIKSRRLISAILAIVNTLKIPTWTWIEINITLLFRSSTNSSEARATLHSLMNGSYALQFLCPIYDDARSGRPSCCFSPSEPLPSPIARQRTCQYRVTSGSTNILLNPYRRFEHAAATPPRHLRISPPLRLQQSFAHLKQMDPRRIQRALQATLRELGWASRSQYPRRPAAPIRLIHRPKNRVGKLQLRALDVQHRHGARTGYARVEVYCERGDDEWGGCGEVERAVSAGCGQESVFWERDDWGDVWDCD